MTTPNLQPPATLLIGPPGAGKTDSLTTYMAAGIETFVLGTEPGYVESLLDAVKRRNLDVNKLHWHTVIPSAPGMDALKDMVQQIGTRSYESLADIKSGIGKDFTRKVADNLLTALANFRCERDGKDYGSIFEFNNTRAFCLDSLSGLSVIAWDLTVGFKPTAHQGEWGVAMNFIEKLIMKLCADRKCFMTVTAHAEKEMETLSGTRKTMASTLGNKLAPKLPRNFSEVVLARRDLSGTTAAFYWATVDQFADLKNRALPISASLAPDFGQLVRAYQERVKTAGVSSQPILASPPVAA